MKILATVLFLFISAISFGQLELVEEYGPNAKFIFIDKGEPVIMVYQDYEELIELYAQDQSLISSITIPIEYEGSGQYNLHHVSRRLFDCDSTNIEYMITRSDWDNPDQVYVKILREDGEEIFGLTNHTYWDEIASNSFGKGIIQVDEGVLVRFYEGTMPGSNGGGTKIFKNTCGVVPGPILNNEGSDNPVGIIENELEQSKFNIFPNPSADILNVAYELPEDTKTGSLAIFNSVGQLVYEKQVGSFMKGLLVDVAQWTSGKYEVVLSTKDGNIVSSSFIKVKM